MLFGIKQKKKFTLKFNKENIYDLYYHIDLSLYQYENSIYSYYVIININPILHI